MVFWKCQINWEKTMFHRQLILIHLTLFLMSSCLWCFPKATVVDVRDKDWDEVLMLVTLQGIVNRQGPLIYLLFNPQGDEFWLSYYKEKFRLNFKKEVSTPKVLQKFKRYLKGYILWDPSVPDTANVATLLAGLEDSIAVSPRLEKIAIEAGLSKKEDLRNKYKGLKRWQIYQGMFDRYWVRTNHRILACLDTSSISFLNLDLSKYAGKTIYIRFEAKNRHIPGAALRCFYIRDKGKEVEVKPGSDKEGMYLYDKGTSWLYTTGDWPYNKVRVADGEQYWIYKISVPLKGKINFGLTILNHYVVKVATSPEGPYKTVAEAPDFGGGLGSPYHQIRDLVVAERGFPFDLSANPANKEEYSVREKLFNNAKPLSWVLGWVTPRDNEFQYTKHASQHGLVVICSSSAPNFSFHCWIKPQRFRGEVKGVTPQLEEDKIYVTFILSDGDALNRINNLHGGQWLSKARGKVPFGWETQPLLTELAPAILNYYRETASPVDCLVASSGGIGYIYPQYFPPLTEYLKQTMRHMKLAGLRLLTVNPVYPFSSGEIAEKYAEYLGGNIYGAVEGYTYVGGPDFLFRDFLWLKTRLPKGFWNNLCSPPTLKDALENIANSAIVRPLFIPIHLTCYYITIDDIARLVSQLDPTMFRVVRPDHFLKLFLEQLYKEQIVVRFPTSWLSPSLSFQLLPLRELKLPIWVSNLGDKPLTFRLRLNGDEIKAKEEFLGLGVGESWKGEVQVMPLLISKESFFKLFIEVGGRTIERTAKLLQDPIQGELPQINDCELIRVWEEEEFFHIKGKAQRDEEALNGMAWVAEEGQGEGNVIHGPYEELPEGKYLAVIRVKTRGDGVVCNADVCFHSKDIEGVEGILGRIEMKGPSEKYIGLVLPFEVKKKVEGERVEYRLFWNGKGKIYLDRVQVYRYR